MAVKNYDKSLCYRARLLGAYKDVLRSHVGFLFHRYVRSFRQHQLSAAHRLLPKLHAAEAEAQNIASQQTEATSNTIPRKVSHPLSVAFLLTTPGMWKSDYLFTALQEDPRFHPYVVIYPYSVFKGFRKDEVRATLERTRLFIANKGFEYIIPLKTPYTDPQNPLTNSAVASIDITKPRNWQDIRGTLQPDIVVFTTPYKDVPPKYFIYHFRDTMTCYVPYGFLSLKLYRINYDLIFHNIVGMHFVETETHMRQAYKYSRNHGENTYLTGYAGTEVFLRKDYVPNDVWKPQPGKKRVIYAPHHSIIGEPSFSTFLIFADEMVKLARKYSNSIQFIFKPHQLLKFKLERYWGKERTDAYYRQWQEMSNTQLEESSYVDMFLTSDAMIHDCGSFTSEYLFTRKPAMYLIKTTQPYDNFCEFGVMSFEHHYHGCSVEDIERFLNDVVLKGIDPMKSQRQQFFEQYLAPIGNKMPSARIIDAITTFIEQ